MTAAQTAAKARGEVVEVGSKKKKPTGMGGSVGGKKGNIANLKGRRSGVGTPLTVIGEGGSGAATPAEVEDEEDEGDGGEVDNAASDAVVGGSGLRKEIITCQSSFLLLPNWTWCEVRDRQC